MIYFSELRGKKVITEDNVEIGQLDDLIFLATESPKVTKLYIKDKNKSFFSIPITFLANINKEIIIEKAYSIKPLDENELYILRNVLDKQIIDIKGNKVVRVNDVALQEKGAGGEIKEAIFVAGVDVGILGIFRQLKLEKIIINLLNLINLKILPKFLSWGDIQPLELAQGKVHLKKVDEKLTKIHAEDLADYLEKTNIMNTEKFLKILSDKHAAKVVRSLNVNFQTEIINHLKPEKSSKFISYMGPDDAVDILLTMREKKRNLILELLSLEKSNELRRLIQLSVNPIGDLISPEYITVNSNDIVRNVIDKIKKESSSFRTLIAIYVVNDKKQLVGVFNVHEMLLQDINTSIYKFMIYDVVIGHINTPVKYILKEMIKYRLSTVPIISNTREILGIVKLTDVIEYVMDKKNA